jgi:hypothetical protein
MELSNWNSMIPSPTNTNAAPLHRTIGAGYV